MDTPDKLQQKAVAQLASFLVDCRVGDFRGKSILEIGFKNGLFLNQCHEAGLETTGIEINKDLYEAVRRRFPDLNILCYDGGSIPLDDGSFDFVVSYQVLEHVGSIEHVFDECLRLLKPGGTMYHVCPNNFSFYEGHYKVIWLPFFNKSLGRLYLKMLNRYTQYYETLNIVKPGAIVRALRKHENINVLSLGRNEFIKKFGDKQIDKVDQKSLQKILRLIDRLGPVKKMFVRFIAAANLYYPLTIIAEKKSV